MAMTIKALILSAGLALPAQSLYAEVLPVVFGAATDSKERVEAGEFLRTYSLQVAAEACSYYNGIDIGLTSAKMLQARVGFDIHLSALLYGNKAYGIIGGEGRENTIVQLEEVKAVWSDVARAVDVLYNSSNNTEAVMLVIDQYEALFELTSALDNDLKKQYANPIEVMLSDVQMSEINRSHSELLESIADTCM